MFGENNKEKQKEDKNFKVILSFSKSKESDLIYSKLSLQDAMLKISNLDKAIKTNQNITQDNNILFNAACITKIVMVKE